ncbi:MAG: HPr family phosphocarrier protein [Clostridiales bacterium]|nr:HPr family phosphocarrier protein [Clostridiales bacterium]
MKLYQVTLNSIDSVKKFVDVATALRCDIDVLSGRYVVDGKSIMALFSIDLNRPVTVRVHDDEEGELFKKNLEAFLTVEEVQEDPEEA